MLLKWLKKIFSDVHSAIVSIIILAIVGIAVSYLPYGNLLTFLKTTMLLQTPLWVLLALFLVLLVYVHLKTKKLSQSFKSPSTALKEIEDWKKEKIKYELVKIGEGVHVFSLKPEDGSSIPRHYICPACYQDSKKSILVAEYTSPEESKYDCPKCKNSFVTNTNLYDGGAFTVDDY